jgi:hypothetical protein
LSIKSACILVSFSDFVCWYTSTHHTHVFHGIDLFPNRQIATKLDKFSINDCFRFVTCKAVQVFLFSVIPLCSDLIYRWSDAKESVIHFGGIIVLKFSWTLLRLYILMGPTFPLGIVHEPTEKIACDDK